LHLFDEGDKTVTRPKLRRNANIDKRFCLMLLKIKTTQIFRKKERKKNSVKKIGSPERDRDGKCDSHPISKALIQRHPEG